MAAAIVFAPGVGFGDGSAQQPPSDVAARMLAPTFDEPDIAAFHSTVFAKRAKEQVRHHSHAFLALAALVAAISFANSSSARLLGQRFHRRIRRTISSQRDRGPPHLQLA
jgi:threonine/homoserine/homoserine lactone efflux protein